MTDNSTSRAWLFGIGTYILWGFFPLYFILLKDVGAVEVITHRAFWAMIACLLLMVLLGKLGSLRAIIKNPQILWRLALAGALIVVNWTTYVYAVQTGRTIDASLGYFINPLMTIAFGVLLLREKITALQKAAIALGAIAVAYLVFSMGTLPWLSIIMALSFALYSLVKKNVAQTVPALAGMVVETAAVLPFLLGYGVYLLGTHQSSLQVIQADGGSWVLALILLIGAGAITAVPLVLFASASRELPLWALGFLQYISPVMQLLIGVLVFNEYMPMERWIGSAIVWLALIILSADGIRIAIAKKRATRSKEKQPLTH